MPGCIVCDIQGSNSSEPKVGDFTRFNCPRCGVFVLNHSAESVLEGLLADNQIRRSLMSHALRKMHGKLLGKSPLVNCRISGATNGYQRLDNRRMISFCG
jgi:hypothetical protein